MALTKRRQRNIFFSFVSVRVKRCNFNHRPWINLFNFFNLKMLLWHYLLLQVYNLFLEYLYLAKEQAHNIFIGVRRGLSVATLPVKRIVVYFVSVLTANLVVARVRHYVVFFVLLFWLKLVHVQGRQRRLRLVQR